jgi:hypothetical protein
VVVPEDIEVKKWAETEGHDASDYQAFITSKVF